VAQSLASLKANDSFHGELERPEVSKAVKHWTNMVRLPPEECEDWQSDERIMSVFAEFRRLEHCCRVAGLKLPLSQVFERRDDLALPDGRQLAGGEIVAGIGDPDDDDMEWEELPPQDWRRALFWQLV
ncbi:unnamed protein product, partial [Polarella glacialis]